MIFFWLLIFLFMVAFGAITGRVDGGGLAKVHEWVERSLIMFFFVLACAPFAGLWALTAYSGVAGIATGHGQYFLSLTIKAIAPERFDFIVRWVFGEDPRTAEKYAQYRNSATSLPDYVYQKLEKDIEKYGYKKLYWRCLFGMCVTGSLVGIPAFILAVIFGQFWGILFLLTGPAKAIAYATGYKIKKSTVPAEYINGALRNVICFAVIFFSVSKIINTGF